METPEHLFRTMMRWKMESTYILVSYVLADYSFRLLNHMQYLDTSLSICTTTVASLIPQQWHH